MQKPITVSGRKICWFNDNHTATTSASDIGFKVGMWPEMINVVSHKTGDVKTWKKSNIDNEGNYYYKVMAPQDPISDWQLIVFND